MAYGDKQFVAFAKINRMILNNNNVLSH